MRVWHGRAEGADRGEVQKGSLWGILRSEIVTLRGS